MFNGIINVYKESGFTSFDVVAKLRGILKQKKIGHTGTLDPMAEGVLMVCLGKATKLVDMLTEGDKIYRATMKLGVETDTEDITGAVLYSAKKEVLEGLTDAQIQSCILSFQGQYNQIPPMYSAIKKDGKKLYEYARAGITIEREARPVSIYDITNMKKQGDYFCFDVHCSKGTYIRSLVRDIGRKLGCYATMSALERTEVHGFSVQDSLSLSEIERLVQTGTFSEKILPVDALLGEYPSYTITDAGRKYLLNGNKISKSFLNPIEVEKNESGTFGSDDKHRIRVYMDGEFVALYDYVEREKIYKPYKMFLG